MVAGEDAEAAAPKAAPAAAEAPVEAEAPATGMSQPAPAEPKAASRDLAPDWPADAEMKSTTVREALRDAMAEEMRKDGDVFIIGSNGGMAPETLYAAVERRFLETSTPRDLTLFHATGVGAVDVDPGLPPEGDALAWPVFTRDGRHLLFVSNRRFDPTYCDFEWEMVFKNVAGIYALTLRGGDAPLLPPLSDEVVDELMIFLNYDRVSGYVTEDYSRARILVRHNISSSDVLNRAIAELQAFIDANIDPALRVEITGKSVLSNRAVEEMAYSQLQSLLLDAAGALTPVGVEGELCVGGRPVDDLPEAKRHVLPVKEWPHHQHVLVKR